MFIERTKLKAKLPAYHVFECLGENFVFDTSQCRFYKIDQLTADFLALALQNSISVTIAILQKSGRYSDAEITSVGKEVKFLSKAGLFESIGNYFSNIASDYVWQAELGESIMEIQLAVSEKCNLACKYCYCPPSDDLPNNGMMPTNVAKASIDLLFAQKTVKPWITFFGGEPLLNKPLIYNCIDYSKACAKRLGKSIGYSITTNATLLDDKIMDCIVNDNFGLMISIDGPRDIHDKQCPTKSGSGSFDIAAQNASALMKRRTVGVRATVTHPIPDLAKLIDFFVDFGFNKVAIGLADNRNENATPLDCNETDRRKYIEYVKQILPTFVASLSKEKEPIFFPLDQPLKKVATGQMFAKPPVHNCGAGVAIVGVDITGRLYPCAKFIGMPMWTIGNAENGINANKQKEMFECFLACIAPHCGICWAYPVCGGPCLWACAKDDGTFEFNDGFCNFKKAMAEYAAYVGDQVQEYCGYGAEGPNLHEC